MMNQSIANRVAGCYWSYCAALEEPRPEGCPDSEGGFCSCYFCENPKGLEGDLVVCRLMFGRQCVLHEPWVGVESMEVAQ